MDTQYTTADTFARAPYVEQVELWAKALGAALPTLFPGTPGSELRFCARFEIDDEGNLEFHLSGFVPSTCDAPEDDDFLHHRTVLSAHEELALLHSFQGLGYPIEDNAVESLGRGTDRAADGVYHWLTGGWFDANGARCWPGASEGADDPLDSVGWEVARFGFYITFDDAGDAVHTSFGVAGLEGDPLQALHSFSLDRFLVLADAFRATPAGFPFPSDLVCA